jgi:hypothetical protein
MVAPYRARSRSSSYTNRQSETVPLRASIHVEAAGRHDFGVGRRAPRVEDDAGAKRVEHSILQQILADVDIS